MATRVQHGRERRVLNDSEPRPYWTPVRRYVGLVAAMLGYGSQSKVLKQYHPCVVVVVLHFVGALRELGP